MPFTKTEVSEIYVAVFNRASEGEGNTFWQGFAGTKSELIDATLATQAAQDYFGAALDTNQAFVEHIYVNTLGKTAIEDPDGIAFWVAKLDASETRGSVVEQLIFAAQQPENAGVAQDQFNNRVEVSDYTADNVATPPGDFATALAFDGDLVVTSDSATITTAKAAVDVIAAGQGGGGGVDPGAGGETFMLTTDQDNLTGGDGDDAFNGYIFDNANTAQSGDMIDGGAGTDSLYADIGNSQDFAITLHTSNVENFAVRAQAAAGDSNENNLHSVQIDAERMVGVTRYESNNSRDDVIIEDVRIESSEITKDITIAMVQTDPGAVDFGVYFDQHSLRAAPAVTAGAVLNLEIMDTRSADAALDPLLQNPFNGFTFKLDGAAFQVSSTAIDDATTYTEFLTAVQAVLLTVEGLEDFTASISGTFQAIDTLSGNSLTGQTITLTNGGSGIIEEGAWTTADGTVPGGSGLHLEQDTSPPAATGNLITSTIILDDVGRGSMGGDLIIGGLSTGGTSDSKGVEQFNITVERSSELQEINSTNNTLEEIYIVNGTTSGNLVIAGDTNGDNDLPVAQGNEGINDVRIFDASAMQGSVSVDGRLSGAVVGKYMTLTDDATNATADNIDFVYTGGAAGDSFALKLSDQNLAAAGTTTREDFTLLVNGGAGNDVITTSIRAGDGTGALSTTVGAADNWYDNSTLNANLMVDGGSGNDTITTTGAGNFTITAGSGNDTVYTDNSGATKAAWVVNATNIDMTNLASDTLSVGAATNQLLYKSTLTVTYSGATTANVGGTTAGTAVALANGFESTVTIGTTDYVGNKANVNQAIKAAINNDAVLNKLLTATDGPGNTLVITSKIDGVFASDDIAVTIAAADFTTLSASEVEGLDTAWEILNANSAIAPVAQGNLTASAAAVALLYVDGASVDFTATVGTASVLQSDNIVNLGAGDDVVVLGTDVVGGDESNDILVFAGTIGNNTVVNFEELAASGYQDQLDFTSYLGGMTSASASVESQVLIATTGDAAGVAATTLAANEVAVVNNWTQVGPTETWANMTAANVLAAIQATNLAGAADYGNLVEASFDAANIATLVGNIQKGVILIENDLNQGEYKVFETSADNTTAEFTAVTLVGTIDFGNSISTAEVGVLV